MFINPKTAIKEGWITWNETAIPDIEKYIQPNAIDFDCSRVFALNQNDVAYLSETQKKVRGSAPMDLIVDPTIGLCWALEQGHCYDFVSNFHCKLPQGVAAELIIRSTLNRSGVFLTSGLYDSGFQGDVCGMLRVHGGAFNLAPNTRIGQIKFIRSEDSGILYSGGYSHKQGTHWSEGIKPV